MQSACEDLLDERCGWSLWTLSSHDVLSRTLRGVMAAELGTEAESCPEGAAARPPAQERNSR